MNERDIFIQSLKVDNPQDRCAYVDEICDGDIELRKRVGRLLHAHIQAESFLETPLDNDVMTRSLQDVAISEEAGQQIGPYKLLEVIGEGGMGTVYMAEQTEPVHRRVALKLIKTGMDTKQVVARFEAERQALAVMDHPNIAKVLDAGSTDSGRPFFVMELVKGRPITKFCDERQLDTESRLKLFQQVCHGVQHAHQKGITHRDIKPSNIMIAMYDDQPVPKVIDFGVAKATHEPLTKNTCFTRFGEVVGTLQYMSPEQAQFNQLDIDTRSDIYSLGAVLYELLAGEPPFDQNRLKSQAFDETLKMIRDEEPTKPSTKLRSTAHVADIAANRNTTPEKLGSTVCGDLDWIVMKAMEKDRSRRYETANALATDVRRFLDGEPVLAAPPSIKYSMQKFVRRNRTTVLAASVVAMALVLGMVGTSIGIVWALREKDDSEKRLAQVVTGNEILTSIFKDLDLDEIKEGRDPLEVVLGKRLVEVARQLEGESIGDPLIIAGMQMQLGDSLTSLGLWKEATELFEKSMATRLALLGPNNADTLESMVSAAGCYSKSGQPDKALSLLEKAMVLTREKLGLKHETSRSCMNTLAEAYYLVGQNDKALPLLEQALELSVRDSDHKKQFLYTHNLAYIYMKTGQQEKSLQMFEKALELQTTIGGPNSLKAIQAKMGLARAYVNAGQDNEAIPLLEQASRAAEKELGFGHHVTLNSEHELAIQYWRMNQLEKSVPLFEKVLNRHEVELGREHHLTQRVLLDLGTNYKDAGRLDEAILLLEEGYRALNNDLHLSKMGPQIIETYLQRGETDKAAAIAKELMEKIYPRLPEGGIERVALLEDLCKQFPAEAYSDAVGAMLESLVSLAAIDKQFDNQPLVGANLREVIAKRYDDLGRYDEAVSLQEQALATRRQGEAHPEILNSINELGMFYFHQEKWDEAETCFREAIEKKRRVLGDEHPDTWISVINLAGALRKQGKFNEAEPHYREILAKGRRVLLLSEKPVTTITCYLGACLEGQGKYAETVELLLEIKETASLIFTDDERRGYGRVLSTLGSAQVGLGVFAAAEANLLEAQSIYAQHPIPSHTDTIECVEAIVDLYTAWNQAEPDRGYAEKVDEWKRKLNAISQPTTDDPENKK